MTAREVLDGINRREARRQAMIEDGSYKVSQTRCNDPERCGVHTRHPENVRVETSHHHSYISHLEALADHAANLSKALEAVMGFEEVAVRDKNDLYASRHDEGCNYMLNAIRAAIENALTKDGQ